MSVYLSVYICMHVIYTNKILGNERVMTFPIHVNTCIMDTSKKQDGSGQCMEYVHVCEKDILFRVITRNTVKSPDKGLVVSVYVGTVGLQV